MKPIKFNYRNYRGVVEERNVIPQDLMFDMMPHPEHHQQPGWVLRAFDLDRKATRSFLLSNIIVPHEQLSKMPNVSIEGYVQLILKFEE